VVGYWSEQSRRQLRCNLTAGWRVFGGLSWLTTHHKITTPNQYTAERPDILEEILLPQLYNLVTEYHSLFWSLKPL